MTGLYRGKEVKDNKWVYGNAVTVNEKIYIGDVFNLSGSKAATCVNIAEVNHESVGMATGLTGMSDLSYLPLFGGDIVSDGFEWWLIEWQDVEAGFCLVSVTDKQKTIVPRTKFFDEITEYRLVGNVHDNPEIMEAK